MTPTQRAAAEPVQTPVVLDLLEQSRQNCLRNFGPDGMADWIYNDLSELLANAAPQQRKPLSDEQIYAAISDQVFWATSKNFIVRVVRDVEAAHGITGGKE